MTEVLADTYYFIAILGRDNEDRRRALATSAAVAGRMVTTAWVLTEVGNFLRLPHARQAYMEMIEALGSAGDVVLIPPDEALWRRGVELYGRRLDKEWSLTDCISFIVMSERNMSEALTADHHFEQAGFKALLA